MTYKASRPSLMQDGGRVKMAVGVDPDGYGFVKIETLDGAVQLSFETWDWITDQVALHNKHEGLE